MANICNFGRKWLIIATFCAYKLQCTRVCLRILKYTCTLKKWKKSEVLKMIG